VRPVRERGGAYPSERAAITSIAGKLGVGREARRPWLWPRRAQADQRQRPGVTTAARARIRAWERENRELRRADDILEAASAFVARALDPRVPTR